MSTLTFIAFLTMIGGFFLILDLSPFEFANSISKLFKSRKRTLKQILIEATSKKEHKGIKKIIVETKEILKVMGKENLFVTVSVFFFIVGTFLSLSMNNFLIIPIMAIGFSMLPFWYVIFTSNFYKKQINENLETTLSVITSSYLRSENFIMAVEENIDNINPPLRDVFLSFLTQTNLIHGDTEKALENIKQMVASDVFKEWIDGVISCQSDKSLKTTLMPIVSKLSDMRTVSLELDILLYEPLKEFISMAILLIGNIPLIYFLNKDWYDTLTNTWVGKGVLSLTALVFFISLAAVIRLTRPIEYRR